MPEIDYNDKSISYQSPLGIYIDGKISGRIHDSIIPKYHEIIPVALAQLKKKDLETVKSDATRQLDSEVAKRDTALVRQSLRNTIDLTTKLLEFN